MSRHGAVDAAVVAYPHGASAPVVAALRERGVRVVDLSADFRLRALDTYERWYGAHGAPELAHAAVYGLPELYRDDIAKADLVANPGCYPTATILALAPLAHSGLLADVVVDAKSGVSGAGRTPTEATHFSSAGENITPYGVDGHRHAPEIDEQLAALGAPVTGAVHAASPSARPGRAGVLLRHAVAQRRAGRARACSTPRRTTKEPFVEVADRPPGVRDVRETNMCRMAVRVDPRTGKLLVFAVIDNLWKGAASQAVQNLNLMFGLPETAGLE